MAKGRNGVQNHVIERTFTSRKSYADAFNEVELDVVFTGPSGKLRVPAFWAGGNAWRVRFAASEPGSYRFETVCSDTANPDLHGRTGALEVAEYAGDNPLLRHGALRVSKNGRHFEHADGTPFFWLADTWWMGLCRRLRWPKDVRALTADRVAKGFTVVQIVAGLYPDVPTFDPRCANEAGLAWEKDYARINPAYFDRADRRMEWLVKCGLVPCIVGCWGYHLPWMGLDKMKKHWRYLVARWGALPVVWCLAGEAAMPWYLSQTKDRDREEQISGWTEMARFVRSIDPYRRALTIHPTQSARDQVRDDSLLDFDMLQTGHGGYDSIPNTMSQVIAERERKPTMPVLVGEVNYEGLLHGSYDEIQRMAFWGCLLSGAAGHTYGANGIWQVNTRRELFGPSPHGSTWGNQPWEEAHRFPGATQLGLGRKLLGRYESWNFEPHQEWIHPCADRTNAFGPYAAGIAGEVRVIYFWMPTYGWSDDRMQVRGIEPGVRYRAFFFDPRTAQEYPLGKVEPTAGRTWAVPIQPTLCDWVLVLERT